MQQNAPFCVLPTVFNLSRVGMYANIQTGFSPNMMMFGREAFQPLDVTLGTLKIDPPKKEVSQYIKELVDNLGKIHETARENLKAKQERQNGVYDFFFFQFRNRIHT